VLANWSSAVMRRNGSQQLTDTELRNLPAPDAGQAQYPDGKIPGFGVRVTSNGLKTFYFTYRFQGRSRRMALGHYPSTSLKDARGKAHAAMTSLARGQDPQVEAPKVSGFSAALDEFVELYCKANNRASTALETERLLRSLFLPAWRSRHLTTIGKADVLAITDRLMRAGTPSAANHAFAAVRRFFNWSVERGMIAISPCHTLLAPAPLTKRTNVIDDADLALLWKAAADEVGYPFGTIFQLLTLTAQRRGEVCGMRWDELDLDAGLWNISGARTKNAQRHTVPLTPAVLEILEGLARRAKKTESEFVFPARGKPEQSYTGYSKGKRELDAAFNEKRREEATAKGESPDEIEDLDWTLHDLRRTAATRMAELGILPHVVERVLNHVSGTFGRVAGIYNRFQYVDEMRDALTTWESHVLALVAPKRAAEEVSLQVDHENLWPDQRSHQSFAKGSDF
jgi:integrase